VNPLRLLEMEADILVLRLRYIKSDADEECNWNAAKRADRIERKAWKRYMRRAKTRIRAHNERISQVREGRAAPLPDVWTRSPGIH
jgi:hypothetical protein